ncbi:ABC transporter permease [Tsukamurella tyrosinosolvens]|nr:ABC transporter permease [Tsukamurella tyrosinosolvens]
MGCAELLGAGVSLARPSLASVLREPLAGPLAALVVACVVFVILTPQFATGYNISLILQQSMVIGILAVAQSLIILTAGIDLSIGATCVLGTVVLAKVAGTDPVLAMVAALGVCMLIGAVNGALVTLLKLPPFIVTLGMFTIVAAATQLYAGSQTYRVADGPLTFLGKGFDVAGFPLTLGLLVLLIVYAATWYVLNRTATGRHVYAVGGNPVSASLAGIKTSKTIFGVYLVSGLIAAIAAWAALGRIPTADPNAFQTANLDTITAVVIGGTSLFGGRGSVLGTLVGALIVGVLRNGLTLVGIDNLYQNIATGVLVIAAVALDQISRRRLQ